MQRPTEDRFLLNESDLRNRIAVLMGGRAAEELVFEGEVSTGAADDLQRATEIAFEMVTHYGMDKKVGQRTYAQTRQQFLGIPRTERVDAAEETAREIDVAIRDIVAQGLERASEVLKSRKGDLEEGAKLLLKKEMLTVQEFPPIGPRRGEGEEKLRKTA